MLVLLKEPLTASQQKALSDPRMVECAIALTEIANSKMAEHQVALASWPASDPIDAASLGCEMPFEIRESAKKAARYRIFSEVMKELLTSAPGQLFNAKVIIESKS